MRLRGFARLSAVALSISVLASCGGSGSLAAEGADQAADALELRWTAPQADHPQPALAYATDGAIDLVKRDYNGHTVAIAPIRWKGVSDSNGAEVDVRITVHLPEDTDGTFGSTRPASSATRCYRFVIISNRNYDQVKHSRISCPNGPDPLLPPPPKLPKLPHDTKTRVTSVLRSADAQTLADDVRTAFTEDTVFARSAEADGRLIVTVGLIGGDGCVVGVRERGGHTSFLTFPREWLLPGEVGCDPALVTNPPQ